MSDVEQLPAPADQRPASQSAGPRRTSTAYSWYALTVLVLCYLFNYVDRNILSILAEDVKRDLGLSDSSIGFLHGTAFAVFYAVFGIPFGRLADAWIRKNLIAIGLFFWSLMTALTGTASTFAQLATYRVGVGVGEASLGPSAFSLIADLFPQRLRATALSIYHGGVFFGAAIGFALGGFIVDAWARLYPDTALAPFGLTAWKVAFFAVGIPGLLMAIWVWSLREPPKGGLETGTAQIRDAPRQRALREFASVVPPLTLLSLWQARAGTPAILLNLAAAAVLGSTAWLASSTTGDTAQWCALAVGVYAAFSWAQGLHARERATFDLILGNRAFLYSCAGFATMTFVTNGVAFWSAPLFLRSYDASPTRVGALLGVGAAVGGWIGVTAGGFLSDRLKEKYPTARVDVGLLTIVTSVPVYYFMVNASTLNGAFFGFLTLLVTINLWLGSGGTAAIELVPARLRSTGSAIYLLGNTFLGFALGPFAIGKMSDALARTGQDKGEALGNAMILSTLVWIVSALLLLRARPLIAATEARVAAEGAARA